MGSRYGYTDMDNNVRSLWQERTCGPEGTWEEQGQRGGGVVFQDCYKDLMIIYGQKCKLPVWRSRVQAGAGAGDKLWVMANESSSVFSKAMSFLLALFLKDDASGLE